MRKQSGFTLIELVVVIVILGILSATALPKFINLQGDAANAGAQGVAGALSSASSINYAKYQVSSAAASRVNSGVSCSGLAGALLAGGVPPNYSVGGTLPAGCNAAGSTDVATCTVLQTQVSGALSQSATIVCTG